MDEREQIEIRRRCSSIFRLVEAPDAIWTSIEAALERASISEAFGWSVGGAGHSRSQSAVLALLLAVGRIWRRLAHRSRRMDRNRFQVASHAEESAKSGPSRSSQARECAW